MWNFCVCVWVLGLNGCLWWVENGLRITLKWSLVAFQSLVTLIFKICSKSSNVPRQGWSDQGAYKHAFYKLWDGVWYEKTFARLNARVVGKKASFLKMATTLFEKFTINGTCFEQSFNNPSNAPKVCGKHSYCWYLEAIYSCVQISQRLVSIWIINFDMF